MSDALNATWNEGQQLKRAVIASVVAFILGVAVGWIITRNPKPESYDQCLLQVSRSAQSDGAARTGVAACKHMFGVQP